MKTLLFLLIGTSLMGAPLFIPAPDIPKKGLVRIAYRDTGSMRPALVGDGFVWVEMYVHGWEEVLSAPIQIGDWVIVRIASDGALALHEVTALNKRAVYTSGINNMWPDGWSPRSAVIGVVRFVERKPVTSVAQVSAALR